MGKPGFATGKSMLFFDWNGTLVNVNETFDKAFVRLVEDLAGRWTDYDRKEALRALEVYKQAWKENARRSRPRTYRQRFARSLKKALGDFPLPVDDAFAEQFHRRLKEEKKRSAVLLPDVADTLKELAERYRLGIISNGGGIDLAAAGLDLYFSPEDCITSREAGSRKPRKEIYEYALRKVGLNPEACVMIGDSWKRDCLAAARAGMDSVWIRGRQTRDAIRKDARGKTIIAINRFSLLSQIL